MDLIYTTKYKEILVDSLPAHITLHFFGDVHRDSSCDVERWKEFLKYTKETQNDNTYYFCLGDTHDFASISEQRKIKNIGLHDQTIKSMDESVARMSRAFCIEIQHMRGKLLGFVEGNHSWLYPSGKSSTEEMAERMDAPYLGWLCHYTLLIRAANRENSCKAIHLVLCHGKAGGRTNGASINQVSELLNIFPTADLYCFAHDHKRWAYPNCVLVPVRQPNGTYKIKQLEQMLCRSGSFKKSYEPDTSGYEMRKLMRPANLGALEVMVDVIRSTKDGGDHIVSNIRAIV